MSAQSLFNFCKLSRFSSNTGSSFLSIPKGSATNLIYNIKLQTKIRFDIIRLVQKFG